MKKLKRCPFCGQKKPVFIETICSGNEAKYRCTCALECGGCGAKTALRNSIKKAKELWNMRAKK